MEFKIIEWFSKEIGNVVRKCGFFILEIYLFLGVSLDGFIEKGCLVEVKKVILKDGEFKEDIFCRFVIYKWMNDNIVLNINYKYFY